MPDFCCLSRLRVWLRILPLPFYQPILPCLSLISGVYCWDMHIPMHTPFSFAGSSCLIVSLFLFWFSAAQVMCPVGAQKPTLVTVLVFSPCLAFLPALHWIALFPRVVAFSVGPSLTHFVYSLHFLSKKHRPATSSTITQKEINRQKGIYLINSMERTRTQWAIVKNGIISVIIYFNIMLEQSSRTRWAL